MAAVALCSFVSLPALGDDAPKELPPLPTTAPLPTTEPAVEAQRADADAHVATNVTLERPAKFESHVELQIGGGATYKSLFGLPMTMGNVDVGLGARISEMVAFNVSFDADFGKTAHGLTVRTYSVAPTIQLVADRFRMGVGLEVLWFGISRVTTGGTIAHGGLGARVVATFDVLKTEPVTLFIGGHGQVDWLFGGGLGSATGAAGLRF